MARRIRRSRWILTCGAVAGFVTTVSAEPTPTPFPAMPAAPVALAGDFAAGFLTVSVAPETPAFGAPSSGSGLDPAVVAAAVRADKERLSRPQTETLPSIAGGPVDRRVQVAFAGFGAADANALAYGANDFGTASMRAAVVPTAGGSGPTIFPTRFASVTSGF